MCVCVRRCLIAARCFINRAIHLPTVRGTRRLRPACLAPAPADPLGRYLLASVSVAA